MSSLHYVAVIMIDIAMVVHLIEKAAFTMHSWKLTYYLLLQF